MKHRQPARPLVNLEVIRAHFHQACRTRQPLDLWRAVADIPVLLAELSRTQSLLALVRMTHANLLAAARAPLTATRDGEPDPLFYLVDELAAQGHLPPYRPIEPPRDERPGPTDREEDQ